MMRGQQELAIIQRMYDLIVWYVPAVNRLPRDFKLVLGDHIQTTLHRVLVDLIRARYRRDRLGLLEGLNAELDVLRYQTRLCLDFKLFDARRYEHVSGPINALGRNLGAWIKQQRRRGATVESE